MQPEECPPEALVRVSTEQIVTGDAPEITIENRKVPSLATKCTTLDHILRQKECNLSVKELFLGEGIQVQIKVRWMSSIWLITLSRH